LEEIAEELGRSGRHLRRAFAAEYNVSPVQYLQTCRLLLAKNLLTDTNLPVLEVAMTAGFGSLRRFNDLFKKRYRLSPTALRKRLPDDKRPGDEITLELGYRPPYLWDKTLSFLAGRSIAGIEVAAFGEYTRTVRLKNAEGKQIYGWLRVGHAPNNNALRVTVSESLLPALPLVLARVKHMFDLYCDPSAVYETLHIMNEIKPGICSKGARVPGCFDPFEMSVRAVLGQQITVKSANTLAARIVEKYGTPVQTGIEGLTRVFPSPENVLAMGDSIGDNFGVLGVTAIRSRTIYELARALSVGDIDLGLPAQPEEEMKKLTAIRGIGSWTAQYIAMRAMEWPDAFLETDAGVKKALPGHTPKELLIIAEAWRPWRSYATINLWNTL
jgi:AraC family transcriptional regulator of adaptative response / DNA-3-methyladenine glycosylase II